MADDTARTSRSATIVTEVTEKASLLVREEIELAKAEIPRRSRKLGKGAARWRRRRRASRVFALIFFLHALAWFFNDLFDWTHGLARATCSRSSCVILAGAAWPASSATACSRAARRPRPTWPSRRPSARDMLEQQDVQHDRAGAGRLMPSARRPRRSATSIETTREELALSVDDLRAKVSALTDWRGQLAENRAGGDRRRGRGRLRDRRRHRRHRQPASAAGASAQARGRLRRVGRRRSARRRVRAAAGSLGSPGTRAGRSGSTRPPGWPRARPERRAARCRTGRTITQERVDRPPPASGSAAGSGCSRSAGRRSRRSPRRSWRSGSPGRA